MGKEARVIAEIGEWFGEGRLQLETEELIFRGAKRVVMPLHEITSLSEENGWLLVGHAGEIARFDLGDAFAAKWVHAIQNPRKLIDKLDVKPGLSVLLSGAVDPAFADDVADRTQNADEPHDLVFLQADEPSDLLRITALRPLIKSTGAIWVLHQKGRRELSHDAIMAVAKPVGLVDVKSAKFSETHGALKLMMPRSHR